MPVVRVYLGGSSGGFPGRSEQNRQDVPPRGVIRAWSHGASRRLVAWLWSVDATKLGSNGWALTLTLGTTPDNAVQWHAARKAVMQALKRGGATAQQWVVEWTALGRPHLHMAVYGDGQLDRVAVLAWLRIAEMYGWEVTYKAQHIVPINDATGWLMYVSKHAARGVNHYQRQGAPDGWERTGRLWGYWGDWPRELPVEVDLTDAQFHRYRRLMVAYQRKRMIASGVKPYRALKLGHRNGDSEKGRLMGFSGWVPEAISFELLNLALRGIAPGQYEWEV